MDGDPVEKPEKGPVPQMHGQRPNEDMIEYAKRTEQKNIELFDCMLLMKGEVTHYRRVLERIRVYCKGCPASSIAEIALEEGERLQDGGEKHEDE